MADTPLVRRASRVLDPFDFLAETGEVWDSVHGQGRRAAGAGRPAKTEGNHELMREIRPFIDARAVLIGGGHPESCNGRPDRARTRADHDIPAP